MNEFLRAAGTFLSEFFSMALFMIFVENVLFSRALGPASALVIIRKKNSILLFGGILTVITVLSGAVTFFLEDWVGGLENAAYYRPLIYVGVIGAVYFIALVVSGFLPRPLKRQVTPMIHISAFNFVVLGTLLLAAGGETLSLASSIGFGLGAGVGFTLAMFFVSIAYDYLYSAAIPKAFRGFPVVLIYIGILSLAIYGLVGHQLPY